MRTFLLAAMILSLSACVQDEGTIDSGAVSDGSTSGSTSGGGTSGGTSGGTPTDPLYQFQWHLHNTGQDVGSYVNTTLGIDTTPTADIDINAEEVHTGTNCVEDGEAVPCTGRGVRVVVSDSGTDYTHPDLSTNQLTGLHRNYSFLDPARWDDDAEAYPSGNDAHGTAVAGIIAAEGWNDEGGRGVAPDASYAAFKYIITNNAVDHLSSSLDKALHQLSGNFDVFNYSYGYSNTCVYVQDYDLFIDSFLDEIANGTRRGNKGTVYVQSAGNSFEEAACFGNTNSTASLSIPYKIVTAAVSADGVKSSYSTPGSGVWVSGLGGEGTTIINSTVQYAPAIYTTDIQDCSSGYSIRSFVWQVKNMFNFGYDTENNPLCNYTNTMNGTSSAAPTVSGVVALMLEANPDLSWREIKHILAVTANERLVNDTTFALDFDRDLLDPILYAGAWAGADNVLTHPDGTSTFGAYVYDYKWTLNAAGFYYSNWYGFGLVDAERAVAMAQTFVPGSLGTYTAPDAEFADWDNREIGVNAAIPDDDTVIGVTRTINVPTSLTIEAVQLYVEVTHDAPGDLAIHLVSPSGTESRLVPVKSAISGATASPQLYMISNAFYGEDSAGVWTLKIYDGFAADSGTLVDWGVNIHGHP